MMQPIMRRKRACGHAWQRAAPVVASLLVLAALALPTASAQTVDDQIRDMRLEMQRLREELDLVKAELRRLNAVSRPLLVASTDPGRLLSVDVDNPSPVPLVASLVVKNGSNRCARTLSSMPSPVSLTATTA